MRRLAASVMVEAGTVPEAHERSVLNDMLRFAADRATPRARMLGPWEFVRREPVPDKPGLELRIYACEAEPVADD